jgi:hypothetical protein
MQDKAEIGKAENRNGHYSLDFYHKERKQHKEFETASLRSLRSLRLIPPASGRKGWLP